jgi:hypothetical protein
VLDHADDAEGDNNSIEFEDSIAEICGKTV